MDDYIPFWYYLKSKCITHLAKEACDTKSYVIIDISKKLLLLQARTILMIVYV
jgi:hypothetical protein